MKFDSYVKHYLENFTSAKVDEWNYEDGCVLMGCVELYQATADIAYKNFVIEYMKKYINADGTINFYEKDSYNIDSISPGKVLFFLYEETKEQKYKDAIEILMDQLRSHPRTKCNNFWHKAIYPNQIWLDGLYMAQPFYMEYETKYNDKKQYDDIISQFKNVRKFLFDEETNLYYHAFDEAKVQMWANKKTGVSKNFWLRAIGWYLMALSDTMYLMDKDDSENFSVLEDIFVEALKGILKYQDPETSLFYQVIDKKGVEGNYLETSGSAMIAYAILKGCRLEILQKDQYEEIGVGIIRSLIDLKLIEEDGVLKLTDICSVAGLGPKDTRDGTVAYYLSESIVCDDQKGTGAFMMAYAQMFLLQKEDKRTISGL